MNQTMITVIMIIITIVIMTANAADINKVYEPCSDAKVQKWDGFSFGLALSSKESFFLDQVQLSPCDHRLSLSSKGAQLAVFRPKVDEISLLTINISDSDLIKSGGFMVAFAGRKYAARSIPVMIADNAHTITSLTLVLEFQEGTLQNLFWKSFGCDRCNGDSFVCLNMQDCAVPNPKCKSNGGPIDCNLSIQLTFSGTDKNLEPLNSWYEVNNLRQYSLYGLYSDVRDSISGQYDKLF